MENVSAIGETVVDENLKTIGKIVDIIGPFSSPYAVIKPTDNKEQLSNKMFYVIPSNKRKERR